MVQVFFVMLFFPVVMNALQYYIIDSFIKDQKPLDHEPIPDEDREEEDIDDDGRTRRRSLGSDGGSECATTETIKDGTEAKVPGNDVKADPKETNDYDPAVDGEGSGSSEEPDSPLPTAKVSISKRDEGSTKAA